MSKFRTFSPYATTILTWGGLRGGISVALALSIPNVPAREPLLSDYVFCGGVFDSSARANH